jgi:cytochrome b561
MAARYSTVAKSFHWTVAFLVLAIVPAGLLMGRIPDGPVKDNLYFLHKSVGVLILMVMTLRLIYRFSRGAPPPESSLKPWERLASGIVHWLLYLLLLATPIVALFGYSTYGHPAPFFGILEIPPFTPKDEHLSERLFYFHGWLGWAVGALFCVHIGAALRHHFIQRDAVLRRMLPVKLGGH